MESLVFNVVKFEHNPKLVYPETCATIGKSVTFDEAKRLFIDTPPSYCISSGVRSWVEVHVCDRCLLPHGIDTNRRIII